MINANKLGGMKVVTADAFTVGDVNSVQIDPKTWTVTHLNIDLTDDSLRELGFKKPFLGGVKICLPVNIVSKFGDVITLKNQLRDLKGMDSCKQSK